MRAKAFVLTAGENILVECFPYKIDWLEGFLHKSTYDTDIWVFSDFKTGLWVRSGATVDSAVRNVRELFNERTREAIEAKINEKSTINTTYQDYVPRVGDMVKIIDPVSIGKVRNFWGPDMPAMIGSCGVIRSNYNSNRFTLIDIPFVWSYNDGDFIPVHCEATIALGGETIPCTDVPDDTADIVAPSRASVVSNPPSPDFYHYSTHPEYVPKVGDRVVITESRDNWDGAMAIWVGKEAVIKELIETNHYTNTRFEDGVGGAWFWAYANGHYKVLGAAPKLKVDSIVFSSSFIDFLHGVKLESRIARIILAVREMQYNGVGTLIKNVLTCSEINYLTYRADNGNISYLPKGKEHKTTEDGKWAREGRQDGKAGKVMRKIFTKSALKLFKETDFEIFNNKFKAKFMDGLTFDIRPNTEIPSIYLEEIPEDGSLGGSCMGYHGGNEPQTDWFDIYSCCKALRIVTLRGKDNQLEGRALLWNVTVDGKDIEFLDRFYVSKDSLYDKFLEYATEKGFYRKSQYKSFDGKQDWIAPDGTKHFLSVKIKTATDFEQFPYIDTFSYGDDGSLNNYNGSYTYNNTDGTRDGGESTVHDDITGDQIDEDDSVTLYDGQVTHQENAVYCENGHRRYNGEYILRSEAYRVGDGYWHESDVSKVD